MELEQRLEAFHQQRNNVAVWSVCLIVFYFITFAGKAILCAFWIRYYVQRVLTSMH